MRQLPLHGRSDTHALTSMTMAASFTRSSFSPAHRTGFSAQCAPSGPAWRAISPHTTEGLRPIKWAIHVWDKPAFTPAIIAARSSTPSIRRHPMISLQTASPLHENCLHPMTLPTYKCVRGQDSHTPNHPLRPYRHDHPTTAVATPKRKRDTKSRAFNVIPPLMWLLLLVTLGAANAAIAFGLVRTERTRDLALWGLVLKVCFLPVFLVTLVVFAFVGSQFSLRPEALPLEFALLTPYAVLSYALMIVTSCYGFAAIIRARDEQVISPETAKNYKRWHTIPIADLVASIRLYMLLRRVDSTVPTNA